MKLLAAAAAGPLDENETARQSAITALTDRVKVSFFCVVFVLLMSPTPHLLLASNFFIF